MSESGDSTPTITPEENGPLQVKGLKRFFNSREMEIMVGDIARLCRCGQSGSRPFCDDTHLTTDFTTEREPERVEDRLDAYEGEEITILDNRGVCSHAGYCTSGLPDVWRMGVEPWIDPDGAGADGIRETIHKCPSGALSYREGEKVVKRFFQEQEPHILVARHGPYWIRGGIHLENVKFGEGQTQDHYALCRCGASRNKPFCDGNHWYAGFRDNEALTIAAWHRRQARTSEEWVGIGRPEDFSLDVVQRVEVGTKTIALVRREDEVHALDNRCPHQGGPLAEGELVDGAVRCPWHGYDFRLRDGEGLGNDFAAETLEVREEEGELQVAAPDPPHPGWTYADVVAETMVEWGVDTVFGMVGHSNLGMADALRTQQEHGRLRYFGIRHEGAASFACSAYSKLLRRPAACLSIAGPGATNLLTGLWDAKVDRTPVLAVTGQVEVQVMGPGAFQEIDLASAFSAVSAFSQPLLHGSNPGELTAQALKNAIVQRDVAHLIFPNEVQTLDGGEHGPHLPEGRLAPTDISPPPLSVDYAVSRIGRSRRPVIIVGYGAREGMDEVTALAEKLHCPVITTFKAKGQISDRHPHGAGVLGRSGTPVSSHFMNEADLLIVFGASFSQHTGITRTKPIIQVDYDRMALGKFHAVDEPIWGEIATTARILNDRLEPGHWTDQREELADKWARWREEKLRREKEEQAGKGGIGGALLFRKLCSLVPPDAVMPVDVGKNTYSFGRYFECDHQTVLMSGYLGSIGFGFPAAMGAWAAVGDRRKVVSISGDGGFGQYMGELLTAVRYGMDITHVLMNNGELAKISKEQRQEEFPVWQTGLHNLSFARYAEEAGALGIRVEQPDELAPALKAALAHGGPSLVEVMTDPERT